MWLMHFYRLISRWQKRKKRLKVRTAENVLLLLSRFSRVRPCATPQKAAHQAPPSLGFSRQEHWSSLPFPSPMHESEMWKWSISVVSDSSRPHGLQPTRLLRPWDFPGKSTGVGCHCLLCESAIGNCKKQRNQRKNTTLSGCHYLLKEEINLISPKRNSGHILRTKSHLLNLIY